MFSGLIFSSNSSLVSWWELFLHTLMLRVRGAIPPPQDTKTTAKRRKVSSLQHCQIVWVLGANLFKALCFFIDSQHLTGVILLTERHVLLLDNITLMAELGCTDLRLNSCFHTCGFSHQVRLSTQKRLGSKAVYRHEAKYRQESCCEPHLLSAEKAFLVSGVEEAAHLIYCTIGIRHWVSTGWQDLS